MLFLSILLKQHHAWNSSISKLSTTTYILEKTGQKRLFILSNMFMNMKHATLSWETTEISFFYTKLYVVKHHYSWPISKSSTTTNKLKKTGQQLLFILSNMFISLSVSNHRHYLMLSAKLGIGNLFVSTSLTQNFVVLWGRTNLKVKLSFLQDLMFL